MSDSREAFERDFTDSWKWPRAAERNADGEYTFMLAASAWATWQRAWASCQGILDSSACEVSGRTAGITESQLNEIWKDGFDAENSDEREDSQALICARILSQEAGQASRQALSSCPEIPDSSDHDNSQALDGEATGTLTVDHHKNNPAMQNVDYEHAGDVLKPGRYKLYTHPASADVQDTCTLNLDPGKAILDHHEKVFGPFPAAYNGNDAVSDICSAIDAHYKSYTHPASAVPDVEYIRALQDACDIIHADANTEENYASFCRIGAVLVKLRAGQEQGQ